MKSQTGMVACLVAYVIFAVGDIFYTIWRATQ